jgi:hypothetical protein
MTGPVLWKVDPIATEGLMSLVTRTARRNLLPSSHVLMRQVGAEHANNPTAALIRGLDENGLADILRQPIAEVTSRRHPPRAEPGFVDSFGVAVRADEIVFRRRRFGPAALRTSAHAHALWSLKTVPCCTEHWQYLTDACGCGAIQRWQSADRIERCDVCNASLADAPAVPVDPALHHGLSFVIGLIDPDPSRRAAARSQLPDRLSAWDGGMVFELALALLPLTTGGYEFVRGQEPYPEDLPDYAQSLAQAAEIVRGWPDALVPLLVDAIRDRAISKRNVRYKGAGHYLGGLGREMLPPLVRQELKDALAPITAPPGSLPAGQIGMREATFATGQEEALLAAARRAGQLRTRICLRSNRILPTLDMAEIEWLTDFLANRRGPEVASHELGLPKYAIGQLAAEGLIRVVGHPYVVARYGVDQMHRSELARLSDRIVENGRSVAELTDPVRLHRVARAIGGGLKPWGRIIDDLLRGVVAYAASGGSTDQILVSAADASRLLEIGPIDDPSVAESAEFISQRDAVEILNLPLKHAALLPSADAHPGAKRISLSQVLEFARDRVTLAELSARTGIHGTRLQAMLERAGCMRSNELGWMRSQALAALPRVIDRTVTWRL